MATKSNVGQARSSGGKPNIHIDLAEEEIRNLFSKLESTATPDAKAEKSKSDLDEHIKDIFTQAQRHREKLVNYFIRYTVVFSVTVGIIILGQAAVRVFVPNQTEIELIPPWALNLLLAGMFGQFIALLTKVTTKVWQFETFFSQADNQSTKEAQN